MVTVIPTDHTLQPCAHRVDRLMHPLPQLRLNGIKRGAHPLRYGFTPCNEMAFRCHRTVVRESKEREGLWFSFPTLLPINLRETTKLDQSRLLRMEFQREACQPFPKLSQKSLGVFALLKADHQIVSVANNYHLSARSLPAPCLNPQVEHIVQIHVRQKR